METNTGDLSDEQLEQASNGLENIFFAMDTVMTVTLSEENNELLNAIEDYAIKTENLISTTIESSEVYNINLNSSGEISQTTKDILNHALNLSHKTDGVFDPSIYPILYSWGFTTDNYRVPTDEELSQLLPLVNYENILLSENSVTLSDGMQIDFGGIAKGYLADNITNMILDAGISSAILDLGGNVQCIGSKPDGLPWVVGIKNPIEGDILASVKIQDKAVVTSGGYERYFTGDDGQIYWHIIDPATGKPAKNELISVSIIAESGVYADGLSTSLFVMGLDGAIDFWRQNDDFDTILVTENTVYVTEGIASDFALMEKYQDLPVEYLIK